MEKYLDRVWCPLKQVSHTSLQEPREPWVILWGSETAPKEEQREEPLGKWLVSRSLRGGAGEGELSELGNELVFSFSEM